MIYDRLEQSITSMKQLKNKETIKKNKAQQEKADQEYHMLVQEVHIMMQAISYVNETFVFRLSENDIQKMQDFYGKLSRIPASGFAEYDFVKQEQNTLKELQTEIDGLWKKRYKELTSDTLNTLNIIRSIASESVDQCIAQIKSAEHWTVIMQKYEMMQNGLKQAEELIQTLGLNDEITEFLEKMKNGRASVSDLNQTVLDWIYQENFQQRIRLKFS